MKSYFLFLAGLMLMLGLSTGCSDSGATHPADAEEKVPVLSEKLTAEEEALIASAEAEAKTAVNPAAFEMP